MSTNGGDLSQQQQQQWLAMQQYQQQQQQWLAMQYPQQHQMMYQQPQYMPYAYQQQHQQQSNNQSHQIQSSSEDNKSIWIGDLQHWMDESYLQSCFAHTGEVISVKLIRNKQTGQSERFGFIEFLSHAAAEKVLLSYNGTVMPNTEQTFRLNWATFSTGERRPDAGSDVSIFVGDLAADVTDGVLHETFSSRYPSVKGAKVVFDSNTGRSKGYGFVRFGDENERSRAMTEMNGMYCSSRPMRISVATPKKPSSATPQDYSSQAVVLAGGYGANGGMPQSSQSDGDLSNTTVFVGGLDSDVTDEELRQTFSEFGEVVSTKIPAGKGCGFVQFTIRSSAEEAISQLNGSVIGKQTVRLSWGRNPGNKQNGNYYGKQAYSGGGGYGYAMAQNQDPSMYAAAAAYGASSNGYSNQ
ncbi:hypothetical protein LguiA_027420 [Lonicera macranthoides]